MTGTTTGEGADRLDWRVLLLFWAAVSAFLVGRALFTANSIPLLEDTDDAMRLVVVRDLLAGQGWYDHLQHRLNTPFGAEIHWSRLVDLPIAGLIMLFRPLGIGMAETLAAYVWPLLLLLLLLWLSARLTLLLVGREGLLAALALPVLSPAVSAEFSPGRLDHHGIQIILTLALAWCTIRALTEPRWAIGAGIAAATALAIGTEGAPTVATAILVFGVVWLVRPDRADRLRLFGLSLAAAAVVHLAIAAPPGAWLVPACDALSIVHVAAALGIGLGFTVLSLLPRVLGFWPRFVCAAVVGTALVLALALLFPTCLGGPYAGLDPWLRDNWLEHIAEAKTLWLSLKDSPELSLSFAVPVLLAAAALVARLTSEPADRARWLVLAAFLASAILVMLVQVRGVRIALPLAVPAAAWLTAQVRARYLSRSSLASAGLLIGTWLGFAGIAILVTGALVSMGLEQLRGTANAAGPSEVASTRSCLMPSAFTDLAGLPPARVMTPVDLGSHTLLFTPHEVVAAPYHRNQAGVRDAFTFLNGGRDEARAILDRRGISLVVLCPGMTELDGLPDVAPDSLVALLAEGRLPPWLRDVSLPESPLRIFAVSPPATR